VSGVFCQDIQNFFKTGVFNPSNNVSWVTLILEKKGSLQVSDCQPISIAESIYKVIAEIHSRRLSMVIPHLVGEAHTTFVNGTQILDGALIANH